MAWAIMGSKPVVGSSKSGVDPNELAKDADSLTFCLSKNLACPFGSLIVARKEFINHARKNRQMVGGGMRQAGIMAAAGIVALPTMKTVQTNMVFFEVPSEMMDANTFVRGLDKLGVRVNPSRGRRVRMVTHYGVTREDIDYTLQSVKEVIGRQ